MDPKDDPEARIRELERSLNEQAASSELGTDKPPAGTGQYGYVPPPPGAPAYAPPPPPPPPGAYGQNYGAPPGGGYGAYPPSASFGGSFNPIKKKSGFPTGWLIAVVGLVVLLPVAGAIYGVISATSAVKNIPSYTPPGIPSFSPGGPGAGPGATPTAAADDRLSLAGVGVHAKAVCDGGEISISGVSNTYEISGDCAKLTVSGSQNHITVDSAEAIFVSGIDNVLTYHSGSPDVNKSGVDNTVEHG